MYPKGFKNDLGGFSRNDKDKYYEIKEEISRIYTENKLFINTYLLFWKTFYYFQNYNHLTYSILNN